MTTADRAFERPFDLAASRSLARRMRAHTLGMVHRARASHVGSCFSAADLLAVLYGHFLRLDPARPDWAGRDRFILSKGHATAVLYAALAERGFFPVSELETYGQEGTRLLGHASHHVPGIELSTGSLGHGLPVGCGLALGLKHDLARPRVVVLLSDGELDEGSNWEAALFAPQHGLDNLIAIVDYNKLQSFGRVDEVISLEPLADKFRAFRWGVREVDGHDHRAIAEALAGAPFEPGRPSVLIAHTVKGKGVPFMEDQLAWHYKSPDAAQLEAALQALEAE
jgi:transketolase